MMFKYFMTFLMASVFMSANAAAQALNGSFETSEDLIEMFGNPAIEVEEAQKKAEIQKKFERKYKKDFGDHIWQLEGRDGPLDEKEKRLDGRYHDHDKATRIHLERTPLRHNKKLLKGDNPDHYVTDKKGNPYYIRIEHQLMLDGDRENYFRSVNIPVVKIGEKNAEGPCLCVFNIGRNGHLFKSKEVIYKGESWMCTVVDPDTGDCYRAVRTNRIIKE